MKRAGVVLILLFAFFGLSDSIYLAQQEANDAPLICNVDNLSGCNIVATSPYTRFLGISIAEYGVMFYAFIFVIAALELVVFDRLLRRVLQGASLVGIIASAYLTFLEIFVIQALCIYCLVSAGIALAIFIFASLIEPIRKL
jgi:uncharacterized membrane protein